jgi:hypothetical protein
MNQVITPIERVCLAAEYLQSLRTRVTFLGGAVVGLLVTDPATRPARMTNDVDVTIELGTRVDYYKIEAELKGLGFQNDMNGPVCRFAQNSVIIDVMPTNSEILGFSNHWYSTAVRTSEEITLPTGVVINPIEPTCFLATKLEAFESKSRANNGDVYASKDFEDIISVIDGRPTIATDVDIADPEVRSFVSSRFVQLLGHPFLDEGIEAQLETGYRNRVNVIRERITLIASHG